MRTILWFFFLGGLAAFLCCVDAARWIVAMIRRAALGASARKTCSPERPAFAET
jgi:hypothetical protein